VAMVHFDQERLAAVISALRHNPAFPKAMALVLESDAWARRADVRARRVADDQPFFDRFPSPGLARKVTPVPLRTPDGWGRAQPDLVRA
jgi:hypothetical protein